MDQYQPPMPQQGRPPNQAVMPVNGHDVPQEYYGARPYPSYPQFNEVEDTKDGFDLYKYLRILIKYRWLLAIITALALGLALLVTYLTTPIYRATLTLQIDREAINVVDVKGVQPEENKTGNEYFQTQYELLASRSLAERAVSTLNLADNKDFNTKQQSFVGWLRGLIFSSGTAEDASEDLERKKRAAVGRLMGSISVSPVRFSRIVRVNIDHPNPRVAMEVANGYGEVYIANNLDRRFEATSYARKFLEERLQQLKLKLEESEKVLVKYAEDQGIINLQDNKNLSSTDLESVNAKLADARGERIKKELLYKQAQATAGLGLKEILDSENVKQNRKLRTELAAEYQQKLAIFKPAFPDMVKLRNQIKELDRQLQTEVEAIKLSIEAQYLAAKEEEDTLLAQLDTAKTDVVDQRSRSIQYNILQREVDTNRQLYDGLLQRYKEIGVAGGVGTNNISIVDQAIQPGSPRTPNMKLNLAIALLAGLLTGFLLALFLDYLDDSFKAPEEIERELGLPVIGVVPKPKVGSDIDEELLDPRSGVSEAIRSLRTGLQFATSEGIPRTILITSSKPSEGKTTTSITLAKSLAQIGLEVLLIDGDLRNASVHRRLGLGNEMGLSNYLTGSKKPEEVVQGTELPNFVIMSSGPLPPNPAELLTGPRFLSLLSMAAESFDVVIVDGPPVMGLADSPLLSSTVHSTLLVVAAHETRRSTAKVALRRLQFARANVIGVLMTKFDVKQTGYGYGYGYGDYEYHSYGKAELPAPGR